MNKVERFEEELKVGKNTIQHPASIRSLFGSLNLWNEAKRQENRILLFKFMLKDQPAERSTSAVRSAKIAAPRASELS